ncbi:LysR substrate-binding domain-containing protein [Salinisphaera sp. LB1]|uniref:LysR substrate-binding domain-containing protein n=1 Tax=Salinisphaera sp. LB1 TaxID=2183911 RepID=UPI000D7077D9|nr:LysR substrate-binding domain-containing protein [Salinisphaera sp. LB1]AWN15290.1 Pca operon transcriptional activator PcaQ [Salinisphaera sp. LB1]
MIHSPIKLRHLAAFAAVARHGQFASAAEALSITQPGMSKTIRELETNLGVVLFERGPRGVTLTPAGRTLLRYTAPALRSIDEGIEAVRSEAPETVIRIGALSNVEGGLLPETLTALHRGQPDLRVEVDTGTSAALLTRLRLGELDLVIGRMSEAQEIRDLTFEHLYYEPMIVVVRSGHPALDTRGAPSLETFTHYSWVIPPRGTTLREQVERYWVEQSIDPPHAIETLSLPLSQAYVLRSDAVWVTPADTARAPVTTYQMVVVDSPVEIRGGSVGFAVNSSQPMSLAARQLCDCLRSTAAEYPGVNWANNLVT